MDIFSGLIGALAAVPDWLGYLVLPALFSVAACIPVRRGSAVRYPVLSIFFGGLGAFLLAGKGAAAVCAFVGLFAAFSALLWPLAKRLRRGKPVRIPAEAEGCVAAARPRPPKVCCFEEEEKLSPAQCGMRLKHAEELLSRLKAAELTATDKLESEMLARTVSALSGRPLSAAEFETLNDCLTSTLKLTAKYKL